MRLLLDYPRLLFVVCLVLFWLAAQLGVYLRRHRLNLAENESRELDLIIASTLTLLALIIGFTFSMAVGRYDVRKEREEQEANAIGTEYVRLGLFPAPEAVPARALLAQYLDQRVRFYTASYNGAELERIRIATEGLQDRLWRAVRASALSRPTAVSALAVGGMNEVFDAEGFTSAAWENRIPSEAWILMGIIAMCCNLLIGYNATPSDRKIRGFVVLPVILAIAFFLIADLDSPRGGLIKISPHNLTQLTTLQHRDI